MNLATARKLNELAKRILPELEARQKELIPCYSEQDIIDYQEIGHIIRYFQHHLV